MIKQIPLDGGLITQIDGEEVGLNACTELINAEFDKPGIIYKRKGTGAEVTTGKTFISILRWVNPYFTNGITWIGLDNNGEVWYSAGTSADLTSWTSLTDLNVANTRIYNHGSFLRVAGGTTVQPKIIQDIDRDFFYTDETTSLFSFDNIHIGNPPKYPTTFTISADETYTKVNQNGGGELPFSSDAKFCFYKFTAVFDGNQELPFKDEYKAFSVSAHTPNTNVQIRLKFDEDDWDPRITSINMYRAITDSQVPDDSLYQKINTFETTLSTATDWINGTGETGKQVFSGNSAIESDVTTSHKLYWASAVAGLSDTTPLYTGSGGSKHTISEVHTNHLYIGNDFDGSNDYWGTTKYWDIVDEGLLVVNGDFESDTSGWDFGAGTESSSSASPKAGSKSLLITNTITTGSYLQSASEITATVGKKYKVSCWASYNKGSGSGITLATFLDMTLQVYMGGSYTDLETIRCNTGAGFQQLSGTFTATGNFKIKIKVSVTGAGLATCASDSVLYVDAIECNKVLQSGTTVYTGDNVFALNDSGVDVGAGINKVATVGGTDYIVLDNIIDVFKVTGTPFTSPSSAITITSAGDQWSADTGNVVYLDTYDTGSPAGVYHPLAGVSCVATNYKYSTITDGRHFVAGVRLDPRATTGSFEDRDNWVIFSELNQYDILPISNYIQLRDLQGGAITGLSSLMGDLVVFMERGIYRVSVPSSDPKAWTLSESEENIGCISDTSISAYNSGLFFYGKDHMYYLDANFQATPVTSTIKDTFQSLVTSAGRTFYDVKKNRLLCRFGASNSTIYSLDLSSFPKERWTKVTTGLGDMDIFTLSEDLLLYSYDETTGKIKPHSDAKTESTSFKRTTGWISQSNLDRSGVLRRLNLKYKSADDITAKCYIDGDATTVVKTITIPADTSGADWYKCKPNVRCRSYMIELSTPSSTNDVEIRRLEVEFE